MKIVAIKSLNHPDVRAISSREPAPTPAIAAIVQGILKDIRTRGHAAALDYARKHDGLKGPLAVSRSEIEKKAAGLDAGLKRALRKAIANVRAFHARQAEKSWEFKGKDGEILGQIIRPLARVGVY